MKNRASFMMVVLVLFFLFVGTPSIFAQDGSCVACHDDTTVLTGMQTGWSESGHGIGESYVRGSSSCAGCHSGGAFSAMVAARLTPDAVEEGDPNPTRQDCRACHQIHTKYTAADWALETTASVKLYAFDNVTYNGGKGNLCVNCHQPRRAIAAPDSAGKINVSSTHWGPHHGPQSAMLLGVGGAGLRGSAGIHSRVVRDSCVTCHLGEDDNHTFEAVESSCLSCHEDADGFDIDGVQTEVGELIAQVGERLEAKGLLDEEGHPVVGDYSSAQASALWNYIFIAIEDGSQGVHNYKYTKDMLQNALRALR